MTSVFGCIITFSTLNLFLYLLVSWMYFLFAWDQNLLLYEWLFLGNTTRDITKNMLLTSMLIGDRSTLDKEHRAANNFDLTEHTKLS